MTEVAPHFLQRIRKVSWFLDEMFTLPGTRYRFGVDPVIGLIPGIGDALGGLLSLYLLAEAAGARVPAPILLRMLMNSTMDMIIGVIPFVGDVGDFFWKANRKNRLLIEAYVTSPQRTTRASIIVAASVLAAAMVLFFALVFTFVKLGIYFYELLSQALV